MTIIISAVAFIILLTVLILIHEWGHFAAAKKLGVTVEEFGFGLPPRAKVLFIRCGTAFTLNWIPFGGFVRMKGEGAITDKARKAKGSFGAASIPARMAILLAGVTMNYLLALILLTYGFSFGHWIPTYLSLEEMEAAGARGEINVQMAAQIEEVVSGGNAAKIGVPKQSIIHKIDGEQIVHLSDVTRLQDGKRRVVYTLLLAEEGKDPLTWAEEEFTVPLSEGKAGIVIVPFPLELSAPSRDLLSAFGLALRESKVMTVQTVIGMGHLFSSLSRTGRVPEGITGIIGIAQLTHVSLQQGFSTYLRLVALLSLSLAVLNILPFPALDGGRLLFVLVELISRRPMNRQFELMTNALGFGFLILLILVITFYDIVRLF